MRQRIGIGLVLLLALGLVATALAQTTGINDREIQRFVLPGTNTTGFRVHASASEMNIRLPVGDIWAAGGYKTRFSFAHGDRIVINVSNSAMPIAGTSKTSLPTLDGPLYQQPGYSGSVIGVSIASTTTFTAGYAHAEATIYSVTGAVAKRTGLIALIGDIPGLAGRRQYHVNTQGKDISTFGATEGVGCNLNTTSTAAPTTLVVVCGVIVEF